LLGFGVDFMLPFCLRIHDLDIGCFYLFWGVLNRKNGWLSRGVEPGNKDDF